MLKIIALILSAQVYFMPVTYVPVDGYDFFVDKNGEVWEVDDPGMKNGTTVP